MGLRTRATRGLLVAATVGALVYAGWWALCEWAFFASVGYNVEAEFAKVPPDDEALRAWLRSQPGVAVVGVNRTNSGRTTRIQALVITGQNFHYKPPFPDIERGCAELGYRGRVAPFRDVAPR